MDTVKQSQQQLDQLNVTNSGKREVYSQINQAHNFKVSSDAQLNKSHDNGRLFSNTNLKSKKKPRGVENIHTEELNNNYKVYSSSPPPMIGAELFKTP